MDRSSNTIFHFGVFLFSTRLEKIVLIFCRSRALLAAVRRRQKCRGIQPRREVASENKGSRFECIRICIFNDFHLRLAPRLKLGAAWRTKRRKQILLHESIKLWQISSLNLFQHEILNWSIIVNIKAINLYKRKTETERARATRGGRQRPVLIHI